MPKKSPQNSSLYRKIVSGNLTKKTIKGTKIPGLSPTPHAPMTSPSPLKPAVTKGAKALTKKKIGQVVGRYIATKGALKVAAHAVPFVGTALLAQDAMAAFNYVKKKQQTAYQKGPIKKRTATGKQARGRGGRR